MLSRISQIKHITHNGLLSLPGTSVKNVSNGTAYTLFWNLFVDIQK